MSFSNVNHSNKQSLFNTFGAPLLCSRLPPVSTTSSPISFIQSNRSATRQSISKGFLQLSARPFPQPARSQPVLILFSTRSRLALDSLSTCSRPALNPISTRSWPVPSPLSTRSQLVLNPLLIDRSLRSSFRSRWATQASASCSHRASAMCRSTSPIRSPHTRSISSIRWKRWTPFISSKWPVCRSSRTCTDRFWTA